MLNAKGQRELAYVVKIDEIIPIERAERVKIAREAARKIADIMDTLVERQQIEKKDG